jgi:hypothetical protein
MMEFVAFQQPPNVHEIYAIGSKSDAVQNSMMMMTLSSALCNLLPSEPPSPTAFSAAPVPFPHAARLHAGIAAARWKEEFGEPCVARVSGSRSFLRQHDTRGLLSRRTGERCLPFRIKVCNG